MTGLNQVLSVSDDLVRYLKACGKTSVLQTKPVNPTQLKVLKLYILLQALQAEATKELLQL